MTSSAAATHAMTRPRGAVLGAPSLLIVAPVGDARSAVIYRQLVAEMQDNRGAVVVDFAGTEANLLGGALPRAPELAFADDRGTVMSLADLAASPSDAVPVLRALLASWLLQSDGPSVFGEQRRAAEALASLVLQVPRLGLYSWRQLFIDPAFRRRARRQLQGHDADLAAVLDRMRPGTDLWSATAARVDALLGHDDVLDRIFPVANAASLFEVSERPRTRILGLREPPSRAGLALLPTLLWIHVLASLAARAPARGTRTSVRRLVVIDPPPCVVRLLPLIAAARADDVAVTVVTEDARACELEDPARWFGTQPSLLVHRTLGAPRAAALGLIDRRAAERALADVERDGFAFCVRRGMPPDLWCAVKRDAAPPFSSAISAAARARGAATLAVPRHEVRANRLRLEANAERARGRAKTRGLLAALVEPDRLIAAWQTVRRNAGGPGIDRVRVEDFDGCWQAELTKLREELLAGRYRPRPYVRVYQPKPSGGVRPMGIPTVRDRVVMTAAAEVLSSLLEPVFSDLSFGYRPGRGARRAVQRIAASPMRATGWAVVADVASYFDSIDHRALLGMVREHIEDDRFVQVLAAWIRNAVVEDGRTLPTRTGVPQGAPVSPVLANLYLTPLDRWAERRGVGYARYADDFVIVCASESEARALVVLLESFLARELHLSIKPSKTLYTSMADGFDFLGFRVTQTDLHIQPAKVEEAAERVRQLLAPARAGNPLADVLDELSSYVRGFRNYFDLPADGTTSQLMELESVRAEALQAFARGAKASPSELLAGTEPFARRQILTEPTAGPYREATERTDEQPPPAGEEAPARTPSSLDRVDRRSRAVRARARADIEPEVIAAHGHVHIVGHGVYVGREGERLTVKKQHRLLFECPVRDVRSVFVESYGATLSTPLLEDLTDRSTPAILGTPGRAPWGLVRPSTAAPAADLLAAQVAARALPRAAALITDLIAAKVANQERLLRYLAKYRARREAESGPALRRAAGRMRELAALLDGVEPADLAVLRRKVFSIEGRAAELYWHALAQILPIEMGARVTKGATDVVNMSLNYGYGVLYPVVWAAVLRAGLDPGIGFLHSSPGNRAALVFDLIEPFRVPVVDRAVVSLLTRGAKLAPNREGALRTWCRRLIAGAVLDALGRVVPWSGEVAPLHQHIDAHARRVRELFEHGRHFRSFRMRW